MASVPPAPKRPEVPPSDIDERLAEAKREASHLRHGIPVVIPAAQALLDAMPGDDLAAMASRRAPAPAPSPDLDPEHHKWLVTFEDRGLPGAVERIGYPNVNADSQHEPTRLDWNQATDFFRMHACRAAHAADEQERNRRRREANPRPARRAV